MDPYCVHPTVKKDHPYGLTLNAAIQRYCGEGDKLKLWGPRQPR